MRLIGPAMGERIEAFVQQGGESGVVNISAYDRNADISVEIQRQPVRHAPERVGVRVVGWSGFQTSEGSHPGHDQRLTQIRYIVDFGDAGSVYSAPENLLPEWMDRNVGYGPLTAHVYRAAGTYTIRVWAYEIGSDRRAYFEQDITIGSLEEAFDGDTVFVTNSGATAPAGVVATYADFASAWSARNDNLRTRILFHPGDVFNDHPYTVINQDVAEALHIGCGTGLVTMNLAAGSAAGFRVFAGAGAPRPDAQLTFEGVRLVGGWDDVTETGDPGQTGWQDFSGRVYHHHLLLDRCEAHALDQGVADTGGASDPTLRKTLHDCTITGFRDVGVFSGAVATTDLLGCRIARSANASGGGPKGGPPHWNNHGPVRLNAESRNSVYIDACDLYPAAGWTVVIDGHSTQQPCLRLNQEGAFYSVTNVQRCAMEGGFTMVSISRQNGNNPSASHTVLLEKINALASHQTTYFLNADAGGWVIRDMIWNIPDIPSLDRTDVAGQDGAFRTRGLVLTGNPRNNPTAVDIPCIVGGVTINNQLSDANSPTGDAVVSVDPDGTVYTNLVVLPDVVISQPNAGSYTAPADYSALTTDPTMIPRTPGYFDNVHGNSTLMSEFASPGDAVHEAAFPISDPLVNSLNADSGATDFRGRKRGDTTAPGHHNPVR